MILADLKSLSVEDEFLRKNGERGGLLSDLAEISWLFFSSSKGNCLIYQEISTCNTYKDL